MTYPRAHLVSPQGGIYHVQCRCVRRAYLCGFDRLTGYNFDHRKRWLETRLLFLSDIFAIDLFCYAVMSNHYHLVISIVPSRVSRWSDPEVAKKWLQLFPKQGGKRKNNESDAELEQQLLSDPIQLATVREKLSSLSWFMRCLNEPLARMANAEDECTGRFWEGRFKSQQILDENALLACMVYVDLNPVRAGTATKLEAADCTSMSHRLRYQSKYLKALNYPYKEVRAGFSLKDYMALADRTITAQQSIRPIPGTSAPGTLEASNLLPGIFNLMPVPEKWQRALGSKTSLKKYAKSISQKWVKTYSASST